MAVLFTSIEGGAMSQETFICQKRSICTKRDNYERHGGSAHEPWGVRIRRKRPVYVKRDLYICETKPIHVKGDLYMSKETKKNQKGPIYVTREQNNSKETKTETYTCQNRPKNFRRDQCMSKETNTSEMRTIHARRDLHKNHGGSAYW